MNSTLREEIAAIIGSSADYDQGDGLLALIQRKQLEASVKAILDCELELRLKFNAKKHNFSTFEFMLSHMNDYIAELTKELKEK